MQTPNTHGVSEFPQFMDMIPDLQAKVVSFLDNATLDNFSLSGKSAHAISDYYKEGVYSRMNTVEKLLDSSLYEILEYKLVNKKTHSIIIQHIQHIILMDFEEFRTKIVPKLLTNPPLYYYILTDLFVNRKTFPECDKKFDLLNFTCA